MKKIAAFAWAFLGAGVALAQTPPVPAAAAEQPSFAFKYDGKDSAAFLPNWTKTERDTTAPTGPVHQVTYQDPATKLKVTVEIRTLKDFPAIDWVLYFSNEGTADTPIIEDIEPLHITLPCDTPDVVVHTACGSGQSVGDFWPRDDKLAPGQTLPLGTTTGRSSDALQAINEAGSFPFFNIQTGAGHGVFEAIGWTGDWLAQFTLAKDGESVAIDSGMSKTHLLLHPGETIRSPRIVLMDWKGGLDDAQNTWRQLVLADYAPKTLDGKTATAPLCFCSGGGEPIESKLAVVKFIHDKQIPADLYWIDAGWYGKKGGSWVQNRGDWYPTPEYYPNGFGPLGDALKAANVGFLVWVEAETAMPGTKFPTEHPGWYFPKPVSDGRDEDWPMSLNLGNPAALKGMTDYVSHLITDAHMTWYRQDFNYSPAKYWAANDKPDRIGMTEIQDITGLYAFWDALRARHPGLMIDNCASGGRRLDIETISRSVALHRSDAAGIPMGEQFHTQGLCPWVPLNDGILGAAVTDASSATQLYNFRSGYSAGGNMAIDPKNFNDDKIVDVSRRSLNEFREVRPYYYGNFYGLQPITLDASVWAAWQVEKLDHSAGVAVCLRRPESIYCTLQLDLHKIDPATQYQVEVRTTLDKSPVATVAGKDLVHYQVTIPDKPGSALVFYHKI